MQNNQKRKRKRAGSETERTPSKKPKKDKAQTPKTPKETPKKEKKNHTPSAKNKQIKKKKLLKKNHRRRRNQVPKRPRLNDIRQKVARTIERALVEARGIPLIYHLFTERDSMGTPRAPLRQILRTLKISNYVKKTHLLKDSHLKSISKFTTMFSIEEDEPHGGLFLKYWPIYDRDDATVYVDNLPEGCCEEKLMRLAECYGTVAELSISKKGARWIRPKNHQKKKVVAGQPTPRQKNRTQPKKKPLINVGSRPRPFGFVRFVDKDSAASMIREFTINDPSLFHEKMEEKRRIEEERRRPPQQDISNDDIPDLLIPGDIEDLVPVVPQEFEDYVPPKPYVELYMTRLLREIRFLKMRRKRRPWPMYFRLWRLQRRFNDLAIREHRCLVKAGIINSRTILRKKQRRLIHKAFPPEAFKPVHHAGRLPPPPTPRRDEPSTSDDSPEEPIFINRIPRKKRHANQPKKKPRVKPKKQKKPKPKPEPKRREYIEKYVNGVLVRKRNRKRKKMSRKLAKFIPGGQVRRFFADIQVFSLKRYRELKAEYQELVRQEKERVREEAEAPPPAPEPVVEPVIEPMEPAEPLDPELDVPEIEPEIDPALEPEMEIDF